MANNCVKDTGHNIFKDTVDNKWSKCTQYPLHGPKSVNIVTRGGGDTGISSGPGGGVSRKSHGQRPYIGDGCYDEMIGRMPYSEWVKRRLGRKSVFDKPYLDDEYQEMEHFAPVPPRLPRWNRPNLPSIPDSEDEFWPSPIAKGDFCSITCWDNIGVRNVGCDSVTGWCYPAVTSLGSNRSWNVISKNGQKPDKILHGRNIKHHPDMGGIEIYPDWDLISVVNNEKCVTYEVTLTESVGETQLNICKSEVTICCNEQCICPADPTLTYDSGNPATIAREGEASIAVTGGCPPYTWSVTGTGFSFANSETETTSNTLAADATACGTAKILVSDYCDDSVIGYVRCTTGQWVAITFNSCVVTGSVTEGDNKTRIEGKYKLYEDWGVCQSGTGPYDLCAVFDGCSEDTDCHSVMGCTQCLTHDGGLCTHGSYPVVCDASVVCCCTTDSCTSSCAAMCSLDTSALYEWQC